MNSPEAWSLRTAVDLANPWGRRRAAVAGMVVVAVVAGLACAPTGDDESPGLDIVAPPSSSTTVDPATTLGSDDDPSSTTTPIDPPGDVCATPLDERRPLPGFDRAAVDVDLDGDGAGDPFFFVPDEELGGSWIQADRSSDGASTTPIRLDGIFGRETFLDAADLDGDGRNEAFLELAGNTFLTGVIIEIEGCELRAITTDDPAYDNGDGLFTYGVFAGGNGCGPTGCITSVVCTNRTGVPMLQLVNAWPVISALDPDFDPDDGVAWADRTVEVAHDAFEILDGRAVRAEPQGLVGPPVGEMPAGAPALAPWWELSGVHCDRLTDDVGECDVWPELRESDEWKETDTSLVAGAPVQYATFVRSDGARVVVTNPGPASGPLAAADTVALPWGEGRITSDAALGRQIIEWPAADPDVDPYCVRWTAWSDDLDAEEMVDAAREILGATDVE